MNHEPTIKIRDHEVPYALHGFFTWSDTVPRATHVTLRQRILIEQFVTEEIRQSSFLLPSEDKPL